MELAMQLVWLLVILIFSNSEASLVRVHVWYIRQNIYIHRIHEILGSRDANMAKRVKKNDPKVVKIHDEIFHTSMPTSFHQRINVPTNPIASWALPHHSGAMFWAIRCASARYIRGALHQNWWIYELQWEIDFFRLSMFFFSKTFYTSVPKSMADKSSK